MQVAIDVDASDARGLCRFSSWNVCSSFAARAAFESPKGDGNLESYATKYASKCVRNLFAHALIGRGAEPLHVPVEREKHVTSRAIERF